MCSSTVHFWYIMIILFFIKITPHLFESNSHGKYSNPEYVSIVFEIGLYLMDLFYVFAMNKVLCQFENENKNITKQHTRQYTKQI